jgi:hypothetical protein
VQRVAQPPRLLGPARASRRRDDGPDYTHWLGIYEVAERFYQAVIPETREIAAKAAEEGKKAQADAVNALIDSILARPEHAWFLAEKASAAPAKAH